MAAGTGQGFAGTVSSLSALDAIQLHRRNRFSGSVTFERAGQRAAVYLQQGEVVHAEAGLERGLEALRAVADWPGGSLQVHANVATMAHTIDERAAAALLEALSLQASHRPGVALTPPPGATPPPLASPASRPAGSPERARAVTGVVHATVLRGGAPVNDPDPRAEALAHRAASLLSKLATPLSKAFGLGELSRGAIASPQAEQFLLFHAQDAYLAVSVAPGAPLPEVEAGIRRALGSRPKE